jgi:Flp pilus assembly protein TadG
MRAAKYREYARPRALRARARNVAARVHAPATALDRPALDPPAFDRPAFERGQRGQALVEFALVLPIFVVLALGVVDGARIFTAYTALTNASREAAIYAAAGHLSAWCRNPGNAAQKAATPPVSVSCPSGATSANYAADPDNIAYRVDASMIGSDSSQITLDTPMCSGSPCADGTAANRVAITVHYQVSLITPFLNALWGNPVQLTSTTTARIL